MYLVSEEYANKIISDDRTFAVRLTFGSSTVLTGATVQNITLDEIVNSGDVLTMGCACSNKITVNLINPPMDVAYDGAKFTAEIGLLLNDRPITYEYIPLGVFYGALPETSNDFKNLKLTAYDGFCKMTDKYNATVPTETTLQAVYDDLKTQLFENCGIVLKPQTLPEYQISNFPYLDITYTQAIGYVAGCLGGNARFDRNGELEVVWYRENVTEISRKMQYMDGFKRTTDKTLTVTSLSTGTKDNPIVRGDGSNGTQIMFENPYITAEMVDDIYEKAKNLNYTPCTVKWRGNPAMQAGDVVQVIDKNGISHNVLVMSQSLKVGGGCSATIDCKGKGETTSQFSNTFESVGQKIERVYKTLEQAILEATNSITGNKGGYVILNDTNTDGKPDEILIMDTEEIATAENVWRWNKEGLGHSSNGYAGPYETAITADGKINASMILTGMLNADFIQIGDEKFGKYIRLNDGIMHFGNADDALSLRLGKMIVNGVETQQVAFYDGEVRKAYFSNNSFEIENIEDGMFRVQNLAIVPRATGNVSFMILQ